VVRVGVVAFRRNSKIGIRVIGRPSMEFRIGVNLGDVVEDGDTIYGMGSTLLRWRVGRRRRICISGKLLTN